MNSMNVSIADFTEQADFLDRVRLKQTWEQREARIESSSGTNVIKATNDEATPQSDSGTKKALGAIESPTEEKSCSSEGSLTLKPRKSLESLILDRLFVLEEERRHKRIMESVTRDMKKAFYNEEIEKILARNEQLKRQCQLELASYDRWRGNMIVR